MHAGTVIAGRFIIDCAVAAGGMGQIFRARDIHEEVDVAVKVAGRLDEESARRFTREATLLATLSHPNIVRYVAHGTLPTGELFLVMEWLEGEDLAARLKRSGDARRADATITSPSGAAARATSMPRQPALRLSMAETVTMARRVASALEVIHAHGLIHRDIKPSNIFLPGGDVGRAKVIDFGLARLGVPESAITRTGLVLGTPAYMSPEQARTIKDIQPAADVWALGAVIYRCLTGAAPFSGDYPMVVLAKIVLEPSPRLRDALPDAPAALDELLARMLAKDPAQRPPNGAAVVHELDELSRAPHERASRPRPLEPPAALTLREQRVRCVIIGSGLTEPDERSAGPDGSADNLWRELHDTLAPYGAHVDPLLGGSILVTASDERAAIDQATWSARVALLMQTRLPGVPLTLVSGRTEADAPSLLGELLDRAVEGLARATPGEILVDALTAELLDGRFDLLSADGDMHRLVGEIQFGGRARPLLGKPAAWVGRDRELSILDGVFAECVTESVARAVLLTAPMGMGKSRLRYEFLQRLLAREDKTLTLFGQGDSLSAGSPFVMIAPAIRRLVGVLDGEPIEAQREKLRAYIEHRLPESERAHTLAFLGELTNVHFPDDMHAALRSAREDPVVMSDAMQAAWETWLSAECGECPVVLVLEDLQWGDRPSIRFVDGALRALRDLPFMVLAIARPDVEAQFPDLWAERPVQPIRLSALSRKASEKVVRRALGSEVSDAVVSLVVARSEGNALYLEELIRAVAAGATESLADTMLGVLQARLDALGSEAKRVLRAGSIFGEVFWRGGVLALLDGKRLSHPVDKWLEHLVSREVIARHPSATLPGEVEYVFRHALVRHAAYEMLTESDRALGHRLGAEWMEASGYGDPLVLAGHFMRGQEPSRALRWYHRAAEDALDGNDVTAAIECAEKAILCGATGESLGALRQLEAVAYYWRSAYAEAVDAAEEAMRLLPEGESLWFRAAADAIMSSSRLGQTERKHRLIQRVLGVRPTADAISAKLICLCRGAVALAIVGAESELLAATLRNIDALAPDRSRLGPHVAAQLHHLNAIRAFGAQDAVAFVVEVEKTVACFEQAGDTRNAALERPTFSSALVEVGDLERAEDVARQALSACERLGLSQAITSSKLALGYALLSRGKLDEAAALLHDGLERSLAQKNGLVEGRARLHLSAIALERGDLDLAEQEARASAEILSTLWPPMSDCAYAELGRVLQRQGHLEESLAATERAYTPRGGRALSKNIGMVVFLARAEALLASGDEARAREVLVSARESVHERASQLEGTPWKHSYLQVASIARLLALADEAVGPARLAG